jgi:two-component SAPR family response regulator
MLVFAIDDEPGALEILHKAVEDAAPDASIRDFRRGADALSAVTEENARPDVVLTDIRMPDMDGLQLATAIRSAAPDARIVFVTAYSQYALEAWKRHANGYLLKPVTAEDVREALDHLPPPPVPSTDQLSVRCFGHFEVFRQGKPVIFMRKQSKELLAFLIDREGAACTAEEIAAALWEGETDTAATKARVRVLLSDLRSTLHAIGMDGVLIRERRQIAVRCDRVDCDYYRMLEGDPAAVNAFRGEYMVDYSWAELTAGRLIFRDLLRQDRPL